MHRHHYCIVCIVCMIKMHVSSPGLRSPLLRFGHVCVRFLLSLPAAAIIPCHIHACAAAVALPRRWFCSFEGTCKDGCSLIAPCIAVRHSTRVQVAVARGDRGAAKRQYERLLGKALRGLGPSEHWAHAEYGALLAADGDVAGALHHLHAAIDVATLADTPVEAAVLAGYHFEVGRVLWKKTGGPSGCARCPGLLLDCIGQGTTPPPLPPPHPCFQPAFRLYSQ